MRCISASVLARSEKSGSSHAIMCRVGSSRLPSLIADLLMNLCLQKEGAQKLALRRSLTCPLGKSQCGSERVESLLEAAGVGPLGFGESLAPLRDLLKAFFASCAGHSGIHVGVFVGLARNSRAEVIIGPADW